MTVAKTDIRGVSLRPLVRRQSNLQHVPTRLLQISTCLLVSSLTSKHLNGRAVVFSLILVALHNVSGIVTQ